jgi:hypothetical protein
MMQRCDSDFHGSSRLSGFDVDPGSLRIPGVPRGSAALAPLGALIGGALGGMALGLSAGPIGLRVGAGAGSTVALLGYIVLRRRRAAPPSERTHERTPAHAARRSRASSLLRFVTQLLGWTLGVIGLAAAAVTGLLIADERASETLTLRVWGISTVLLVVGGSLLWCLPRTTPRTVGPRPMRYEMRRR